MSNSAPQFSRQLEVVKAGIQTSVQDLGRQGLRHVGIAQSGALDAPSLRLANRLLGNAINDAGLEIVIGPVSLRFLQPTWFAICGADFKARLDNVDIACGWRVLAQAGQVLHLVGAAKESRAYLAVDGGIQVPEVLGARATDLQAGFGGFQGRALRSGDILPLGEARTLSQALGVLQRVWTPEIRAIAGPEYAQFCVASRKALWTQAWKLSPQSNRMGVRLQAHALNLSLPLELQSHAVLPGVVQVPPNGQPIVLLADAQTTGGYPRIATVIDADLWKLGQTPAGAHFCFQQVDLAQAYAAREQAELQEFRLERSLDWKLRA